MWTKTKLTDYLSRLNHNSVAVEFDIILIPKNYFLLGQIFAFSHFLFLFSFHAFKKTMFPLILLFLFAPSCFSTLTISGGSFEHADIFFTSYNYSIVSFPPFLSPFFPLSLPLSLPLCFPSFLLNSCSFPFLFPFAIL